MSFSFNSKVELTIFLSCLTQEGVSSCVSQTEYLLCGREVFGPRWFISACVCAHEGTLIYVSANVGALGSGTPEYTRWNVECVFR